MRIVSLNNSHISISDFVRPQLHDRNNVGTLKLCFIGRYHKRKNLERIYNFINESTIDGLHLTLVGPGMTEVFRPTEFIDVMDETIGEELDSILSQQNAIVCPGLIGLLALDAAKFGLPVLVQKGLKHGPEVHLLVESDQYFIDFEDSEVLSETLVYLKSHPQELVCKGQALQDVAIEKYNVEHSVHVLIDSIS